ncbi:hypothetical protein TNCV_3606691 [Trichonephila clavipes]|nr:hypothetical protein TNCV_3606691 [Trichonephila clavipes]
MDIFYTFEELLPDTIPLSKEHELKKVTLQSNKLYYVPENVSYILVARHICFFMLTLQLKEMLSLYEIYISSICDELVNQEMTSEKPQNCVKLVNQEMTSEEPEMYASAMIVEDFYSNVMEEQPIIEENM